MPDGSATSYDAPLWPSENARGYKIPEQVFGTLKPLKVIAIGAGISGISLAHDVQERGQGIDLTIYEMGNDVGGTWFWNKYPGCRCDVPSVNYQMSWSPNPDWPEFYAEADEIHKYYRGLAEKFDLLKYIHLEHEVIRAEWDGQAHRWRLQVRRADQTVFEDDCDVFINAGGVLNAWKWPDIKGLHDFKGTLCHTARWPKDLDHKGKTVAVVGSGSSGIQLLATIQPEVKQIYHWIRSPTWITSAFAQKYAGPGGKNFQYTDEQKKLFAEDPKHSLKYRKMIESELNQRFKFIVQGTAEQKAALEFANADMRRRLGGDQRLIDAIVPTKFVVGCRRPTPGNGYLEALLQPNVHTFTNGMLQRVTPKGFIDSEGIEHECDIFVCATGFDTSFRPRFPVVVDGVNVQERWREYPVDAYMSIAIKGVPNYFMYYGPHGPTGHGSGAPMIEAYTRCFLQILRKIQTENITTMTINPKAVDDFNEHRELYLKRTAWAGRCSSWFKPGPDVAPVMFPGNRILFIELLTNPRWEDWDYEYGYAGNRFGYWGNGFTMRELDGRDTTFYYGLLEDHVDEQPDYEDVRALYATN
ncbi:FAD/NAD-P-binding domain-containing protein [Stereum hirsutum FP-91666 SS1]|uniref:FAD/NAD-P-binding domain-containing protein n=1 Tax=Stereum hirsutum (strain FP-91666) TaxID=721885 RepID=UPI000440A75E|nr:FAD/NAD-P-binding domain-containing protein [Stereum hirsutum FP-91666 SS1]EIM91707.1 FAD/NAD-P-binding domain-containing protein [Stereum hirsutum FP-91666 SS1]